MSKIQVTKTNTKSNILVLWSALGVASQIHATPAQDFSCSQKKRTCVIDDTSVVTGDSLGFFTNRGELIAKGTVTEMIGSKRSVQLTQILGPVHTKAESYAMLEGPASERNDQFKMYKHPTARALGTHVGLTSFGAGSDAKGMEGTVEFMRRRFFRGIDGTVRGGFYTLNGTAENVYGDQDTGKFSASIFAASGGVSHEFFSNYDFVIRTEIGLGLTYTVAKINNSISDAASKDWGYEMKSGFAPYLRGQINAGYKFKGWQLEAGVAPALIANKQSTTIGAGVLVNLK